MKKTSIHPQALKAYRELKHWTQPQLAEATAGKNPVSLPTIKRIEGTKGSTYEASNRVAEALARALGISTEELSSPPTTPAEGEPDTRPLRTTLSAETMLAFDMVRHIYGIPVSTQLEMAPLFAALLAEGSLDWRKEQKEKFENALNQAEKASPAYFSMVCIDDEIATITDEEDNSIEARDIFGTDVLGGVYRASDLSLNNPFADFLQKFGNAPGRPVMVLSSWKTSEGMPEYQIGYNIISELTGGDRYAEFAFLQGHVQPEDIPSDLKGPEKKDARIAWIIEQIPEDVLARRKAQKKKDVEEFKRMLREATKNVGEDDDA